LHLLLHCWGRQSDACIHHVPRKSAELAPLGLGDSRGNLGIGAGWARDQLSDCSVIPPRFLSFALRHTIACHSGSRTASLSGVMVQPCYTLRGWRCLRFFRGSGRLCRVLSRQMVGRRGRGVNTGYFRRPSRCRIHHLVPSSKRAVAPGRLT